MSKRKIDPKQLDSHRETLVRDGLRVVAELKTLIDATERCLRGDLKSETPNGSFPLYTIDLLKATAVLYQLGGAYNVVTNIKHERR